jgi:hypothetical protein
LWRKEYIWKAADLQIEKKTVWRCTLGCSDFFIPFLTYLNIPILQWLLTFASNLCYWLLLQSSATNFCYFTDISNVVMNSFRRGHENIMPSRIFKFYSTLCKGGKNIYDWHSRYLYKTKQFVPANFSAYLECARQIQTVIPANRWKVFCLSQDGEQTDFSYSRRQ